MDNVTAVMTGSAIVAGCGFGMIAFGMAKVAGKYDRDTEAMATTEGKNTPRQVIDNLRKAARDRRSSPFLKASATGDVCDGAAVMALPEGISTLEVMVERGAQKPPLTCEICQGTLFADYASFAIDSCPRCGGMAAAGEGDVSQHRPQHPASPLVLPKLTDDDARELKLRFDQAFSDPRYLQALVVESDELSRPQVLAGGAIRHTAQALSELTRFNVEGAKNERFPLDEDVEVFLAKALQATINILLAYQPSEHEREELGQLEAALHKFITDYSA